MMAYNAASVFALAEMARIVGAPADWSFFSVSPSAEPCPTRVVAANGSSATVQEAFQHSEAYRAMAEYFWKEALGVSERHESDLGQRLRAIRRRIVESGTALLDWEDLDVELRDRRGGVSLEP